MRTRNVRKFLAPLPSLAGPSQLPRVKACPGSLGLRRVWRWKLTAGPDLGQDPSSCLPGRLSGSSQGSTGLVAVALSCHTRVCCAPGHFRDLCVRPAHRPGRREGPSSRHMPLPWHAVAFSDVGAGRAPASPAALLQKLGVGGGLAGSDPGLPAGTPDAQHRVGPCPLPPASHGSGELTPAHHCLSQPGLGPCQDMWGPAPCAHGCACLLGNGCCNTAADPRLLDVRPWPESWGWPVVPRCHLPCVCPGGSGA